MSKLKLLGLRLGLVFVTIVILLLMAEVGTRLLTPIGPALIERHPVLGKRYRPHFEGDIHVPEAGREIHLRFNADGFRGGDLPRKRTPGSERVAVIGDSFIVAVAIDEAMTTVRRLEDMLGDSNPESDWEVQNFGVSSSSTGQQLVLYRELVSDYRPDIVVCAYSMRNDFADNSHRMSHLPGRIAFELDAEGQLVQRPIQGGARESAAWLNRHSRFYVWQKRRLSMARGRVQNQVQSLAAEDKMFQPEPPDDIEAVWELNLRLIETLRDEVEANGSRFVLALLPRAEQTDPELWQGLVKRAGDQELDRYYPEQRLVEFCRERGIAVIPMADAFREAHQAQGSLHINRAGHYNEAGNLLLASEIQRFLTENSTQARPE